MSTANKLSYLNDTKSLLRTSLNKFGSNILTTDTFRSYDTKLNDIYDKLPKVTQSGAGFTLENVQNGQVDDFKMIGTDLEQNGTPTPDNPQEIKVVENRQVITNSGKNLLNSSKIEKLTRNGITCSYNSETQEITFNGTCTLDNTLFQFNDINIYAKKNVTKFIVYYVSGTVENYFKLRFYDSNYMYGIIMDVVGLSSLNNKISSYSDDRVNTSNYTINTFRFNNGSVANNLRVKVMVTDDDNTDYEPYYNPVSYNIDLHGKNVFNLEKYPFTPKVAYSSTGYQELNWTGYSGIKDYFPINGNTTYSFSNSTGLDIYYGLVFYDKNKTIISNITAHTTTFTTPSNCEYIRFSIHTEELPTWVQIEEGSTTTNYEEYYDYKLAKIPNTDYKNRVYKNNGNWYFEENIKKVVIDETIENPVIDTSLTNTTRILYSGVLRNNNSVDNNENIVCNCLTGIQMWRVDIEGVYTNWNDVVFRINKSVVGNTKDSYLNWLSTHNVELWYILSTPVTTQITNTTLINQLEAISVHTGTNIITISNDNNIIPEIEITRLKELEKLA